MRPAPAPAPTSDPYPYPYPRPRRQPDHLHPFEVMGTAVRRRIVEILASGEHAAGNVCEVVAHDFGITRTAVSKHLRMLRESDFVEVRYEESTRFYMLSDQGLRQLEREVKRLRRLWKLRIALYAPPDNIFMAGVQTKRAGKKSRKKSGAEAGNTRRPATPRY